MSWEHDMARELRRRDNKGAPAWFAGEVLSPRLVQHEEAPPTYEGPLIISCMDGQVMLRAGELQMVAGCVDGRLHDGMRVALCGNLFSGDPGSLKILVLGVVQDAV